MRFVHITSSVIGGAGLAAFRFHKTMLNHGLNSILLNKIYEDNEHNCYKVKPNKVKNFLTRLFNFCNNRCSEYLDTKYKAYNFEYYSRTKTLYRLDTYCKKDDVIILHWVADFLDYKSFFKNIDEDSNIFIYVHDFNCIQGRLHTLFDKEIIKGNLLEKIETFYRKRKMAYYHRLKKLKIIANSNFTYDILCNSGFFSKQSLIKIHLGLPEEELKPVDRKKAKKLLGFKETDFLILTSSNNLESKLKGYDRMLKVFSFFKDHPNVKFIGLGKVSSTSVFNQYNFFNFNSWEPSFKSVLFSASDVTLSTSYEETFGQTIIESYACETPAIVYNNAALSELVNHYETGFIVESNVDLCNFINVLMEDSVLKNKISKSARAFFLQNYTSDIQLKKFLELLN